MRMYGLMKINLTAHPEPHPLSAAISSRSTRIYWPTRQYVPRHTILIKVGWRRVHGSVNDTACQLACEEQDRSLLIAMFGDVVVGPVVDARDPDRLAFRLHPDEN